MNTLGKIRNILATGVLLLVSALYVNAQTYDYTVNWSDTSTYKTTCGKIVPAQWSVKNDSCVMTTPHFRVEATEGCKVSFNFRINQSGNGDPTDRCYVYHQIDDGDWVLDTLLVAGGSPAVYPFSDFVNLNYGHYIQFKICMTTNDKTEFWAIKGGNLEVTDGNPIVQNISSWSGKPPQFPEGPAEMPVELMIFNAKEVDGVVELNWATASETNNDFYTIERSVDGISFEGIGFVQGAGNSNAILEYKYSDYTPIEVAYYRLKQTDFDGRFSYSGIIKVDAKAEGSTNITVNGSGSALNLLATTETSGNLQIDIYTLGGNLVYSAGVYVEEGSNTLNINPEITTNSIYIVNVSVNNGMPFTTKIYLN
jgi:hypothetical protein